MKKVLMVSYNFPPVGGAGVQRPVKFVKYLRDFGWEPLVLTVANPSVPVFDHGLLKEVPEGVRVVGAATLEPSYARKQRVAGGGGRQRRGITGVIKAAAANLLLPDLQVLWWPGLVAKLLQVIRSERPELLFVSAPPFSSFVPVVLVGRALKIPVVVDYRDEWGFSRNNWENAVRHSLAKRVDAVLEALVVRSCTAFTAANRSYVDSILAAHPGVPAEKGFVVTNGYDEDDLAAGRSQPAPRDGREITVVYTGTVWKATSLRNFVTALKRALLAAPQLKGVLKVKIFGRVLDAEEEYLADPDLAGVVQRFGYLEHLEVMAQTVSADVLLLTLSDLPGAGKIITGKAFEYMASGRHILALVPGGETRELLTRNYNKLSVVDPGDIAGIRDALLGVVGAIDEVRGREPSEVSRFSRRSLTGALASVFDGVVDAAGAGKRHVMHVVESLEVGGMENGIVNLANGIDRSAFRFSICCLSHPGSLCSRLAADDIEVISLNWKGGFTPALFLALYRIFRSRKVDIVHAHGWLTLLYGGIPAFLTGAALINGEHGTFHLDKLRRRVAYRALSLMVKKYVAVSHSLEAELVQLLKGGRHKILAIPNGVDVAKFCPRAASEVAAIKAALGIPECAVVIGSVGRLEPVKNYEMLLHSFAALPGRDLHCLLVGDGSRREDLARLARELGISERVHFPGKVADPHRAISALDVYVSTSWSEGMSNTILEAIASGKPVVATDVGDSARLVADGYNGFLVPAGDTGALQGALTRLLRDQELLRLFGQRSRAMAEEHYDLAGMVLKYQEIYLQSTAVNRC